MTLARRHGGLNFPTTIYAMTVEIISRADASLMNLYGLQDIASTIAKYGTDAQRDDLLPDLASGRCTGAMALTEPDAGSDVSGIKNRFGAPCRKSFGTKPVPNRSSVASCSLTMLRIPSIRAT